MIDAIREQLTGTSSGIVEVAAENAATVSAFLAAQTQWRTVTVGGGMGPSRVIYLGLDYAAVRVGIEAAGIAITPELWMGLQVMEAEATTALNERH